MNRPRALEHQEIHELRGEIDWIECNPAILGVHPADLSRVVDLVQTRGAVAQLCVILDGKVSVLREYCDDSP
jgi:hypothetical protein